MKKSVLIIFSVFLLGFVLINKVSGQNSNFEKVIQKDSSTVNYFDLQKLKLYPNPASDYLNIDYDIIYIKEAKLKIYNSIGAVIFSKILENKQDNFKISVIDFDNGLYFCSLQIDGKLINTKKILINHR